MTSNKCSCGARDKAKCSKENGLQGGKNIMDKYAAKEDFDEV